MDKYFFGDQMIDNGENFIDNTTSQPGLNGNPFLPQKRLGVEDGKVAQRIYKCLGNYIQKKANRSSL